MTQSSWAALFVVLFAMSVLVAERVGALDILAAGGDADATTVSNDSGLQLVNDDITLLRGCANAEFLQWTETTDKWGCSNSLTSPAIDGTVTSTATLRFKGGDLLIEKKLDVGIPGTISGLDVGEGGSYKNNSAGTTILRVHTYDASASSGSRFSEVTNLDTATTWLGDNGDRLCMGSPNLFWAARFNVTTAIVYTDTTELLQMSYWSGSALTNMDHMGISKDDADSVGEQILKQTTQKEYVTYDNAIKTDWATADNQTDKIPNTGTALYWVCFQVPAAGLATPPVIDEFRIRGTDFDVISGTGFPVFWGEARTEGHTDIPLAAEKSPGGTGTANIDIDTNHKQTVFNFNGAGDNVSFIWTLPTGIDTSSKISVEIGYSANAADTFTIDFSALRMPTGTAIGSGVSSSFTSTTDIVAAASATFYSGQSLTATKMSIQELNENDTISFEIQRTDTANQFYPMTITIHFVQWTTGEHV